MATTPTNKPIPSEDPRDLKFNAGKIDEVVNSDAHYYTDRFGQRRLTSSGFQHAAEESITEFKHTAEEAIRNYGYITMDSFEDGATLTLPNQALRHEANGEYYRWDGEFPKVVPAGSTPDSTGEVKLGAWVSVGDASLRSALQAEDVLRRMKFVCCFLPLFFQSLRNFEWRLANDSVLHQVPRNNNNVTHWHDAWNISHAAWRWLPPTNQHRNIIFTA